MSLTLLMTHNLYIFLIPGNLPVTFGVTLLTETLRQTDRQTDRDEYITSADSGGGNEGRTYARL